MSVLEPVSLSGLSGKRVALENMSTVPGGTESGKKLIMAHMF